MWSKCTRNCETKNSIYNHIIDQIHVMNFRFSSVIDCAAHSGCHIKRKQMIRMKLVWHICERERFRPLRNSHTSEKNCVKKQACDIIVSDRNIRF